MAGGVVVTPLRLAAWGLVAWTVIGCTIWVGVAKAAPSQAEADRIATWMARELRADVPTRTLAAARHHQLDDTCAAGQDWTAYMCSEDTSVLRIRPWLVGALERRTCHALRVMLHELAHSPRGFSDTGLEEGVADALSLDLYPAAARQLGCRGRGSYIPGTYYRQAEDVWTTSVAATGSRDRVARAAREWVRRLWAADPGTRVRMVGEARS